MSYFNIAIEKLLKVEGGYANNPSDRGGETNYGIAKKYHPNLDIKNLTRDAAIQIYKKEYWDPFNFDLLLNPDVATAALDTVVNQGQGAGAKYIQRAANVAEDGKIGAQSIAALNHMDPKVFLNNLYSIRKGAYLSDVARNPGQSANLKSWLARIDKYKAPLEGGVVVLALAALGGFFFI